MTLYVFFILFSKYLLSINFLMHVKNSMFFSAFLVFICSAGCANNETNYPARNNTDTTGLPPVETKTPNTKYKPAFSGQTRVAGVRTSTSYKVEKIAEKLGPPFAIAAMPDGRLMV